MTTGSGMPPQAYTKETLADAYEWLKNQPSDVRRIANNSDTLVGLYLNFQRRKQEGFDSYFEKPNGFVRSDSTPVSGEQFKKELKTLAIGLNEFVDDKEVKPSQSFVPPLPPHGATATQKYANSVAAPASASLPHEGVHMSVAPTVPLVTHGLDPLSIQRIQSVRQGLNLSHDNEALRMLITLGFDRVKNLLSTP
jgi:hypothetical protein